MKKHLYDIFANKWSCTNNTVWVFSDPHFNDCDSKYFRGDSYIGDEEQVKRINSKVGKKDTIIFLGDICDVEFIKKIRGYKVLILGNHDKGASNYLKTDTEKYLFDEVYEGPLMVNDRLILSHEPIYPLPEYLFNIHGHVHAKVRKVDSQHLNVCAEHIDYTPVNLTELLKKGLLKDIPNIHRPTIDAATSRKIGNGQ